MKFFKKLYVSEYMEKKKEKVIKNLKAGKIPFSYYILVLIEEGENQLEFYSTSLLYQKKLKEENLFIVGLAAGYEDAIYLVEDITREVYEKTGTADIRSYIRSVEHDEYCEG